MVTTMVMVSGLFVFFGAPPITFRLSSPAANACLVSRWRFLGVPVGSATCILIVSFAEVVRVSVDYATLILVSMLDVV